MYIDNWYQTPPERRLYLEHICEEPDCAHPRYLHGYVREVWTSYRKVIEHEEGQCMISSCACKTFHADPPITKDEVLDVHDAMRYGARLSDVGIKPVTEACRKEIVRTTGKRKLYLICVKDKDHTGDCDFAKG